VFISNFTEGPPKEMDAGEKIYQMTMKLAFSSMDRRTFLHTGLDFVFEIFGLKDESEQSSNDELPDHLMNLILDIRATVKAEKNYSMADKIRDGLKAVNIQIKDSKEGSTWEVVKQ
jgi:cysteinyl-tRNA synthetase